MSTGTKYLRLTASTSYTRTTYARPSYSAITAIEPNPLGFTTAEMSASELTPPSYSSAEKPQNICDIASEGEYLGPIAGSVETRAGELWGASESTSRKRTTCEEAL